MSKNITIIPPSESRPNILRVAAYCRVSTDLDEQASSYASQIRSYTELISQHEGWELVDIYADEAVSGTKTENGVCPASDRGNASSRAGTAG